MLTLELIQVQEWTSSMFDTIKLIDNITMNQNVI